MTHFRVESVEQSVSEMIRRIGAYILFTFIEASRPIEDASTSSADKDKLFHSWLEKAIPINDMFGYFHSLYRDIDKPEEYRELNKNTIEKLTNMFKENYNEIYNLLVEARSCSLEIKN